MVAMVSWWPWCHGGHGVMVAVVIMVSQWPWCHGGHGVMVSWCADVLPNV